MFPTAAHREADAINLAALYDQARDETIRGLLWILEDRLSQPLTASAKAELRRLRHVLATADEQRHPHPLFS